jgi:carboxymethylenebutenolidase
MAVALSVRTILQVLVVPASLAGCVQSASQVSTSVGNGTIPPGAEEAPARLAASTRHGEWVTIRMDQSDSVRAWVVYPERGSRAPVVVVIHEIFGLTTWVRAVADQLAADGFIAVAPDLLTGKRLPMPPDSMAGSSAGLDSAVAMISALDYGQVIRRISTAGNYGATLPAANSRWGVIGFCWGGAMVLAATANDSTVDAAVAFYGSVTREQVDLASVRAPTLGLFAENDARVNVMIPYVESSYRTAGAEFESAVFAGAGHGFLREQDAHAGANLAAAREAWRRNVDWLRRHL